MRPIALGVILAVSFSLPGFAAEPDGPGELINQKEAVRIAIQSRLSPKANVRKAAQGAMVEYYSVPDQPLLWVDEKGVTERGKLAMAEIAKADDYGLRSLDYTLPKPDTFNAADAKASDWLADAEIQISYAVLGYANDARGGRLEPQRLSENLDPTLALPDPSEVLGSIAIRSDPAAYLRSFQPDQPQFEALRQKLLEARGRGKPAEPVAAKPDVVTIPDGPVLKYGVVDEQVVLLRKRLEVPTEAGANEKLYDKAVFDAVRRFQLARGAAPDGLVGSGTRRMLNSGQDAQPVRQITGQARIQALLINMERWRWLPHDLGPLLRHGQHPRIHAARRRGRQGGAPDPRRDRQARQADADILRRDGGDRVQSLLERAELDQGAGDRALPAARRRLLRRRMGHFGAGPA